MTEASTPSPFKRCTLCGAVWETRSVFLADARLKTIGYMVHFEDLCLGLFLFNHESCGTTLSIQAGIFADLYDGPVFAERRTQTADCPAYCLRQDELKPCPAQCECAYVREILQWVLTWPKSHLSARQR